MNKYKGKTKSRPKTSMGSKREVEMSAALWVDLLGYGAMLRDIEFDPSNSKAKNAITRLTRFHKIVADHSGRLFPTVVMNDGAIGYRTFSPRSKSVTSDFLVRSYKLHMAINEAESSTGDPGARSILAVGFRVRTRNRARAVLINGFGRHLVESAKAGELPIEEAIYKALTVRQNFDVVPELQANFAFTKAYLADRAGSKGGFPGANFFVDMNMLPEVLPSWIDIVKNIEFKYDGLSGMFGQVKDIQVHKVKDDNRDLLDAFEIAERVTGSTAVCSRLKKLRIRSKKMHHPLASHCE